MNKCTIDSISKTELHSIIKSYIIDLHYALIFQRQTSCLLVHVMKNPCQNFFQEVSKHFKTLSNLSNTALTLYFHLFHRPLHASMSNCCLLTQLIRPDVSECVTA